MRFEHQGMCLWYDAPEAPAPSETVPTGTEIPITVGVQPAHASNRVEVLYRRNQGPTETAPARWLRNDPSGKTQYYRAGLPALEAGDTLEYTPICRCAGRQVPSPEEAQEFASSFRAVWAGSELEREGVPTAAQDFQEAHGLETSGVGDKRTGELVNSTVDALAPEPGPDDESERLIVRGQIRHADGSPLFGGVVRAVDWRFRGEADLGQAVTDQTGNYQIIYTPERFRQAGRSAADLSIRAFTKEGILLGESPIVFEAQPVETVDLVVTMEQGQGISEYEKLVAQITPLIKDVHVSNLTQQDVTFLAGKTGIDVRHLELFVQAARLSRQTELPAEALYGLFRRKFPTSPEALFAQTQDVLRGALESALEEHIVSTSVGDDLEAISEQMRQLQVEYALQPRDGDDRPSLGDLLRTTLPSEDKRRALAARFLRHDGLSEDFWNELREQPEFEDESVDELEFTMTVGSLTQNHLPLVRELQQIRAEQRIEAVRELASLTVREWEEIGSKRVNGEVVGFPTNLPGDTFEQKAQNMVRAMEAAFPTAAFAYRLGRDAADNLPFTAGEKQDLTTFVLNNPGFELGSTVVDKYLEESGETALQGVADESTLREQLKQVQRVFKLAPRYDETLPLLADGLDSARSIVRAGKDAFVNKYSDALGDRARAEATYEKASQASAMALMLFARHNRALNSVDLAVTKAPLAESQETLVVAGGESGTTAVLEELTSKVPDLKTLFGSLDLCDCEHCRSVYSSAAYLVDILQFLERRPSKTNGKTALDVLLDPKRRADIGTIELSCENTNTPVPYVDLVNEVLEDAVAPPLIPIGHWKFDEGQGSTTADSSANGNAGTLLGHSGGKPSWDEGKLGSGSLSFSGRGGELVRIGATQDLVLTNKGSISAWIHPKGRGAVSSRGTIIAKEGEYIVSWALYPGGGGIDWRLPNREPRENWHAAGRFIAPVNEWTHIAIVFDKGNVRTYANGQLVDDASGTGSLGLAGAQPKEITIGRLPGEAQDFYGVIDDVRIYDRGLSAEEVRASMAGFSGRQTRGTQKELAAHPEYTNTRAYDRLASAVYPWSLPHERWVEEARVYLEQLGVPRHELMGAFRKKGNLAGPTSIATVGEHLGLTTTERKIITDAPINPPTPWHFWNLEPGAVPDLSKNLALASNGATATASTTFDNDYPASSVINGDRTASFWGNGQEGGGGWQDATENTYPDWIQINFGGARTLAEIDVITLADDDAFVGGGVEPSEDMTFSERGITDFEVQYWDGSVWVTVPDGNVTGNDQVWRKFTFPSITTAKVRVIVHGSLDGYSRVVQIEAYDAITSGWISPLTRAQEFLRRSELEYDELVELLDTSFVNPNTTITLDRGGTGCKLEDVTISNLDEAALVRILRFLRLRRRLGWTIRGLDRTIAALKPRDWRGEPHLTKDFVRQISHAKRLQDRLDVPLSTVLSWWAPMDTLEYETYRMSETPSLYRQVFLNKAVANPPNAAFELDALAAGTAKISDFAASVSAALEIGASELALLSAEELNDDELNLTNLSHLYRVTTFSKALGLTVREFLSVKAMTGIRPVRPVQVTGSVQTHETLDTLRFAELVGKVRASGLSVAQLDYLLRHEERPPARISPAEEQVVTVLREVGDGLRKIEDETAVAPDPTEELLRKMMTSAAPTIGWGEADVNRAVRMLDGSMIYAAPLDALPAMTLPEPLKGKVSYEPVAEQLRFVGPMTPAEKTQLLPLSNDPDYRSAVEALFQEPRSFVSDKMASFLDLTDATTRLLDQTTLSTAEKFGYVLTRLSANLRRRLGENLVKQKLGEALKLNPPLADSLLTGILESTVDTNRPLVEDFLAFADNGLSATYYDNANLTGATVRRVDPGIDFDWGTSGSPDPGITGTFSVRWTAKLLAPRTDTYTFYAHTDGGVRLWIGGQQLIDEWNHSPGITEHEAKVTMQAGRLYDVEMEYSKSGASARAELRWASSAGQKEIVPQSSLHPSDAFAAFARLHKAALLVGVLGLTTQELAYVHTHKEDFADFDLNMLPLEASGVSRHLLDRLGRLFDLASLKNSMPRAGAGLLELFGTAAASEDPNDPKLSDDVAEKLALATGWTADETESLTAAFELTDRDFKNEEVVLRLRTCVNLSRRLGVSTARLREWAVLVPDESRAREIKDALKAKYGKEQWLTMAKPLSDTLREEQRSALVDYILARPGTVGSSRLRSRNELFEHFLVDTEMSPCQATSRIKLAIGSVQLFVQRCLINLEPEVSLTPQDAAEWKWTKSYRVWEANRKVFLYPENWTEPGVRDDKTPFFKDLENELLQNEVTADTAETALLRYLEKLDAVARLEICSMYHQIERNDRFEVTGDVLHVFGRTMADPRIYYYRRQVNSSYWTAWEKIDVDIMGNHLIPVVYNRRLYLFWPILTEKTEEPAQVTGGASLPNKSWVIQLSWSEYRNGRWSAKKTAPGVLSQPDLLKSGKRIPGSSPMVGEPLSRDELSKLFAFGAIRSWGDNDDGLYIRWYRSYEWAAYAKEIGTFRARMGEGVPRPVIGGGDQYQLPWQGRPENMMLTVSGGPVSPGSGLDFRDIDYYALLYDGGSKLYVPDHLILAKMPSDKSRVLYPHQFFSDGLSRYGRLELIDDVGAWYTTTPFFFQDDKRTFFLTQERHDPPPEVLDPTKITFRYRFEPFYHSHVRSFIRELNMHGIEGLLRLENQLLENRNFYAEYGPQSVVDTKYPVEDVSFGYSEAYAQYNWELFFHAPLTIADQLSKNQRFEEAQKWFHYIFDPTVGPTRGLSATYYDNVDLTGTTLKRVDRIIDFDWGTRSPDPAIGPDTFSVQWTGKIQPEYTETYTFYTRTDDGVKLWVDNKLIIDQWKNQSATEYSGTIALEAGRLYDVKMQYYENGGVASAQLKWGSWSTPKAVVPQSCLYPDPGVTPDSPARYWQVRPFFEEEIGKPIEELMRLLATKDSYLNGGLLAEKRKLENEVLRWRENPFNPHLIARLRRTPYQRAVVMKYLDNLIAWGDQLFRRDTIESINEATQLYVLAAALLGERPAALPEQAHASSTFRELRGKLDAFSNTLVRIENLVPAPETNGQPVSAGSSGMETLNNLTLYFGIPRNDTLLGYWDTVEDRLFKIRHCQNIEGVERQLPLFEPPIDPGLLVRAFAAGLDMSSVLSDVNASLPHYRFATMAQKATELCADVKSLGAALLSALEKRDAEALALLRSGHEIQILNAVRQVKERQIEEAEQSLEGLRKSKEVTEARRDYYRAIVKISGNEKLHMDELGAAHVANEIAQGLSVGVSLSHMIPDFHVGAAGISSPYAVAKWGGTNLGPALQAAAGVLSMIAAQHTHDATMASIKGGYERRWEDWKQQENLANKELAQIDKQILAAEIRLSIAEKDLENHDLQVENAREVDAYMRDKYTNQELYDWMVSQISTIYFQSYQLAYDVAKRAERAYRFELSLKDSSFIQFGYWDSLKKGLLAGERLHHDLKRMEVAYLDQNRREYELTKQVSLVLHDPLALIALKETGRCHVELPEALFDMDYPGHYRRRIKSVSLTIPAVTGPYTSINCTLTLLKNKVRIDGNAQRDYEEVAEDNRFVYDFGSVQSIATSQAQDDRGMFELNFRDERYLPFEGAGTISEWRIDLPRECNAFDFGMISDVVLRINYTAREGGELLRKKALGAARLPQPPQQETAGVETALPAQEDLRRLFSAKHEFFDEWNRFLRPADTPDESASTLSFDIGPERLPFRFRGRKITINKVDLFLRLKDAQKPDDAQGRTYSQVYAAGTPLSVTVTPSPGGSLELHSDPALGGMPDATGVSVGGIDVGSAEQPALRLSMKSVDITAWAAGFEDLLVVCHYSVATSTQ